MAKFPQMCTKRACLSIYAHTHTIEISEKIINKSCRNVEDGVCLSLHMFEIAKTTNREVKKQAWTNRCLLIRQINTASVVIVSFQLLCCVHVCLSSGAGHGRRHVSTWEERWRVCVSARWKDDAYQKPKGLTNELSNGNRQLTALKFLPQRRIWLLCIASEY